LAQCGGNTSVLEKFHCQVFSDIISSSDCEVFGAVDFQVKQKLKQLVFSMIINTDMSFHNQLCNDFKKIDFKNKTRSNIDTNEIKVLSAYLQLRFDHLRK